MTTHCNLNIFNNTNKIINATQKFAFHIPILPDSLDKHKVIVTRADYSVNNLPVHYINRDIEFTLRQAGNPQNIIKTCVLKAGFYNSVNHLIKEINKQIIVEIGTFKYADGLLSFKSAKGSAASQVLYFPYYLKNLFDYFDWESYDDMYSLLEKDTANYVKQEFSTVDRFFNRKAIRIEAVGLGAKAHLQNDTINGYTTTTLLTDQVLLGSTTDRLIYIPTQYREIELLNNSRITNIDVNVTVEWSNGAITPLTLTPGGYVNILLMFQKINTTI